jgi:hypothetical protein
MDYDFLKMGRRKHASSEAKCGLPTRANHQNCLFDSAAGNKYCLLFFTSFTYHKNMARGWESKSVEDQQSSPVSRSSEVVTNHHQQNLDRAKQARQKQELDLQRERILSERTSSPVRRAALEAALAAIESRLALLS